MHGLRYLMLVPLLWAVASGCSATAAAVAGAGPVTVSGDDGLQVQMTASGMAFLAGGEIVARMSLQNGRSARPQPADTSSGGSGEGNITDLLRPGVYPGIDQRLYLQHGRAEYDFNVQPGADPQQIVMVFTGQQQLRLGPHGELQLATARGALRHHAPHAYQLDDHGQRSAVAVAFTITGRDSVSFRLGAYDPARQLVIDPAVTFASYLGGSADDEATAITADHAGNMYLTGRSYSGNFPTTVNAADKTQAGNGTESDVIISKYDAAGVLQYSTYLGRGQSGGGFERGMAITVSADGQYVYVAGALEDQPQDGDGWRAVLAALVTPSSSGTCNEGSYDAFVAVMTAQGQPLYLTCFGGAAGEEVAGVAVDGSGNIYLTGTLYKPFAAAGFSGTACAQTDPQQLDVFLVKLVPNAVASPAGGYALGFCQVLAGSSSDEAHGIAIDATTGAVWVVGETWSTDLPTAGVPWQTELHSGCLGCSDAFIARYSAQGVLEFSTYLGGANDAHVDALGNNTINGDGARSVFVDGQGQVYVAGQTSSTDWPLYPLDPAAHYQATLKGMRDGFIVKLEATGNLVYSGYMGGAGEDAFEAVAVNVQGQLIAAGRTTSSDLPASNYLAGKTDLFVIKFDQALEKPLLGMYLGGSEEEIATCGIGRCDIGRMMALDGQGRIYLAGRTRSTNLPVFLPTAQSGQAASAGAIDALVARVEPLVDVDVSMQATAPVAQGGAMTYRITVTNQGPDPATAVVLDQTLDPNTQLDQQSMDGRCSVPGSLAVRCLLATLAAGQSTQLDVTVEVNTDQVVTSQARVAASEFDAPMTNNAYTLMAQIGMASSGSSSGTGGAVKPPLVISDGGGTPSPVTPILKQRGGGWLDLWWLALALVFCLVRMGSGARLTNAD
ncbi:MAG: DUF11 domain-containing protein [Gammaproteobacteria bacterium]|nr:DUF11 domain-containing protein [Gammaproteobacteria bacterium]